MSSFCPRSSCCSWPRPRKALGAKAWSRLWLRSIVLRWGLFAKTSAARLEISLPANSKLPSLSSMPPSTRFSRAGRCLEGRRRQLFSILGALGSAPQRRCRDLAKPVAASARRAETHQRLAPFLSFVFPSRSGSEVSAAPGR